MPRQVRKKCGRCKYLVTEYNGKGDCFHEEASTGMQMHACKDFKEGAPLVPTYKGKRAKVVSFDPKEASAFVFQSSEKQLLALMWQSDKDGYGFWRIKQIGLSDKEAPVTKQLETSRKYTAFYGEASVVGVRMTDLYRTDGYEDDDVKDEDGNITNKPVEIRIFPRRYEDEEN